MDNVTQSQLGERGFLTEGLTTFVDTATVGIYLVSLDGTILDANPTVLDLLGYQDNEFVGTNIEQYFVSMESSRELFARLGYGEDVHDLEVDMLCHDGSTKHVVVNANRCMLHDSCGHSW